MSLVVKYFESNSTLSSFPKSSTSIRVSIKLPSFLLFYCYFFNNTLAVPVIAILLAVTVTTILLPLNPLFAGGKTPKVHGPGNTSSCSSSSSTNSVGASSSVSGSSGSCSTNSSSSSKTTTAGSVIITSGQSSVGLSTNSPRRSKLDQDWRWSIMLLIRYSRGSVL